MHQVFNYSKQTKNDENMRLELLKGVKLFFQNFWSKLSSSSSCVLCIVLLLFNIPKTFAVLEFARPMTQKSFNLVK
jgi:hypothetical protein